VREPDSVDSVAASLGGSHGAIPILPRGVALFESIPAPAIVLGALGPAIGNGAVLLHQPGCTGVILVRDGDLFEEYAFEAGARLVGEEALRRIASWQSATVSAYRFDRQVVSVAPALFRGRLRYEGLQLRWTDWKRLLADLRRRNGLFAVELDTPTGRGVTLIGNGRQVATYTEAHPELGDDGLLDPLAATGRGTIRVRHEPGGDWSDEVVGSGQETSEPAVSNESERGEPADAPEAEAREAEAPGADAAGTEPPDGKSPDGQPPDADGAAAEAAATGPADPEPLDAEVALPELPHRAAGRAAVAPAPRRDSWLNMLWRRRGRQVTLLAGCVLILTGLGLTAPALIEQATVQQAVAARGANDVNAVNSWLTGTASPGPASTSASTAVTAGGGCGGASSESDAYALVEFTGLPRYGYLGVAVNGNWTQLDDRSMVHWYGSPAPGGDGNVIIAFHREPAYQNIDQLGAGETVTIEDRSCQTYVYTVTQRWVLDPSAVTQLVPTGGQQLTLITCTPWWQDYDRIVWRADLTSVDGVPVTASS